MKSNQTAYPVHSRVLLVSQLTMVLIILFLVSPYLVVRLFLFSQDAHVPPVVRICGFDSDDRTYYVYRFHPAMVNQSRLYHFGNKLLAVISQVLKNRPALS